eukprot:9441764-Ditylum_brightwellii.AAC.1
MQKGHHLLGLERSPFLGTGAKVLEFQDSKSRSSSVQTMDLMASKVMQEGPGAFMLAIQHKADHNSETVGSLASAALRMVMGEALFKGPHCLPRFNGV